LQTVGEILRTERLKRGLSIKNVESAISIRALYLDAIEEGNYSIIPGEVYLKGFIRNYATFLELNSQQIMKVYRESQERNQADSPAVTPVETIPAPPASSSGGIIKWFAIAIVVAGVVAGAVWWSSESQTPVAQPPSATSHPETASQQPASPSQSQSAVPDQPTANVSLTAIYHAQCWTKIVADDKEIYEGIPKSGDSLTWEATTKLIAKFGDAGAVELVYNGRPMGKLGGNGDVVVKNFTVNGITQ